jgi:hypothetical protein
MGEPSKHPKSIVLNHCWICQVRFIGDGGTEPREDHHIIPRAFGGTDGPTVTLCDSHHTKVHRIAEALRYKKTYFPITKGESPDRVNKLVYLAVQIQNAYLALGNDPNKLASVMVALNGKQKLMVDQLKKVYPRAKSREAILLFALESLYSRHFGK